MEMSTESRNLATRSGACCHAASPLFHFSAVSAANCGSVNPLRCASASSNHGWNCSGLNSGKRQQQIPQVAFRIDAIAGMPSMAASSSKRQAQPGLATPGHADAHRMCRQVLGIVADQLLEQLSIIQVILLTR